MKIDTTSLHTLSQVSKKVIAHANIITFIFAMLMLIYCVYVIQQMFDFPYDSAYYDEQMKKTSISSFDKKTIDQVKQLRTSNDTTELLPTFGRTSPFIE